MTPPLSPLQITAGHILVLADLQEQAARGVWSAQLKAEDVNERVAKTHGTVCDDTSKALKRAEAERMRASRMVQEQSEDLAVKLRHASRQYDAIDAQEKRNVDQRLRPGG